MQMFTREQTLTEVEASGDTCDAYLSEFLLPAPDLPGPTPSQRTKPNVALFLIDRAVVLNRKPRIVLVAGRSAATLKNGLPGLNNLFVQAPLPRPATGEVTQTIIGAAGKVPCT